MLRQRLAFAGGHLHARAPLMRRPTWSPQRRLSILVFAQCLAWNLCISALRATDDDDDGSFCDAGVLDAAGPRLDSPDGDRSAPAECLMQDALAPRINAVVTAPLPLTQIGASAAGAEGTGSSPEAARSAVAAHSAATTQAQQATPSSDHTEDAVEATTPSASATVQEQARPLSLITSYLHTQSIASMQRADPGTSRPLSLNAHGLEQTSEVGAVFVLLMLVVGTLSAVCMFATIAEDDATTTPKTSQQSGPAQVNSLPCSVTHTPRLSHSNAPTPGYFTPPGNPGHHGAPGSSRPLSGFNTPSRPGSGNVTARPAPQLYASGADGRGTWRQSMIPDTNIQFPPQPPTAAPGQPQLATVTPMSTAQSMAGVGPPEFGAPSLRQMSLPPSARSMKSGTETSHYLCLELVVPEFRECTLVMPRRWLGIPAPLKILDRRGVAVFTASFMPAQGRFPHNRVLLLCGAGDGAQFGVLGEVQQAPTRALYLTIYSAAGGIFGTLKQGSQGPGSYVLVIGGKECIFLQCGGTEGSQAASDDEGRLLSITEPQGGSGDQSRFITVGPLVDAGLMMLCFLGCDLLENCRPG